MHPFFAWGAPTYTLEAQQWVPHAPEIVFEFFKDPQNLPKITPAWLGFLLEQQSTPQIGAGTEFVYKLYWMGIPYRWRSRIEDWAPNERFVDVQLRGPYILWHHTHTFTRAGNGTLLGDCVRYRLPFGPFGMLGRALMVRRQLDEVFEFRQRKIAEKYSGGKVLLAAPK
jgi:ligand-binding SRPBCC domain-containing protein